MTINIGASLLSSYLTCPRMCYFTEVKELQPIVPSDKLLDGIGFHLCIGAYFSGGKDPIVGLRTLEAWKTALYKEYYETNGNTDDATFDERVNTVTNLYNAYMTELAPLDKPYKVIAVEQEFECPIIDLEHNTVCNAEKHTGTIDRVVEDGFGLWLGELKSAAAFPSELSLELNIQNTLYMLGATEIYGKKPEGIIFDVTRKVKNPARARTDLCKRTLVMRSEREVKNATYFLLKATERYLDDLNAERMHAVYAPGMHCDWRCAFSPLCAAMNRGDDWEGLAQTGYTKRNRISWEDKIAEVMQNG